MAIMELTANLMSFLEGVDTEFSDNEDTLTNNDKLFAKTGSGMGIVSPFTLSQRAGKGVVDNFEKNGGIDGGDPITPNPIYQKTFWKKMGIFSLGVFFGSSMVYCRYRTVVTTIFMNLFW
jgi:hypothetical protein